MGMQWSNPVAAATASHGRVLPQDVLFDILLRLPAKDICRFRAVCRHWQSLTSEPLFIEAHTARHPPDPLITASSYSDHDGQHVHVIVMDLSGRVVKRVPSEDGLMLVQSRLDLICVSDSDGRFSVMNRATGDIRRLPETPPEEDEDYTDSSSEDEERDRNPSYTVFALWRVDSTGEYKVLRLSAIDTEDPRDPHIICSVLTINNRPGRKTRWTYAEYPPENVPVVMDNVAVIDGAVYFFWSQDAYDSKVQQGYIKSYGFGSMPPDCIACFDLETEEWTTIPGPELVDSSDEDDENSQDWSSFTDLADTKYPYMWERSTLSELDGYLVLVQNGDSYRRFLDIWFLTDIENHVWEKEYSIWTPEEAVIPAYATVKPLLLLEDGRIVIFLEHKGVALV
ncbi:hypothetical protein PR202_ga20904 [Eleusine coracana subsp. coracana]|uniref:F-box domain-containing protein n=1 Tax=Eleusine coracana subsp. coracana TaxID=191504 RepID=A0AAV5CZH9_ELECO|nr:hypothetical protein QOZ80_8AG0629740 [Eleusine coracana subsp. coracana]GJN03454.1 hypothetical protein PR202_ga20904 [Eleusine coracana subsp. coracana]